MIFKKTIKILSSLFGIGYIPFAPGTIASFFSYIFFWYFNISKLNIFFIFLVFVLISILICSYAELYFQNKDDKRIVLDEFIGVGFSIVFVPHVLLYYVISFIFFRIFDIYKPLFVNKTQNFKSGLGIVADDVCAGILANICVQVIVILL
jgi:phosphatidylglycerophosphatase A